MENIKKKSRIIKILLLAILILYYLFMYMDLFNIQAFISSNTIKFISMILVFIICVMAKGNSQSNKDLFLLKIGLSITLIADIFLLLLNNNYILGIGLFAIVQIIYSIRYKPENTKAIIRNFIIILLIVFFIYIVIDKFVIEIDFLIVIALYYAICLLSSTIKAIQTHNNKSYEKLNSKMVAVAMVLFLLCDINVALHNIIKSTSMTNSFTIILYNISFISMWFFYLPSQVLLSLSGYSSNFLKYIFIKQNSTKY